MRKIDARRANELRRKKKLYALGFLIFIILISIAVYFYIDRMPVIDKSTRIYVYGPNEVRVEEQVTMARKSNLTVRSLMVIAPDSGNAVINFKGLEINGRLYDRNTVEFIRLIGKFYAMGYYQLKTPLNELLDDTEHTVTLLWKYHYKLDSPSRHNIGNDSVEAFTIPYLEPAANYTFKAKVNEKITVVSCDTGFSIDALEFKGFEKKVPKLNEVVLARISVRDSTDVVPPDQGKYLLLRKNRPLPVGGYQRQVDITSLDKIEENWNIKILPDSIKRNVIMVLQTDKEINLLNPRIIVNIEGKNYFPLPISPEKRLTKNWEANLDSESVYYYSGMLEDDLDSCQKFFGLTIYSFLPISKPAAISLGFQYNPVSTHDLIKNDYFHYKYCYNIGYCQVLTKEDELRVNIPNGFHISNIISKQYTPIDSGSNYLAFVGINNTKSINNPLIVEFEREGVGTALFFRWVNIVFGVLLFQFVFWKLINKYFNMKYKLFMKKILWPIIISVLLPTELSYIFGKSEPYEVVIYTYYWIPLTFLILTLPFIWEAINSRPVG